MAPKGFLLGLLVLATASGFHLAAQTCSAQINCGSCNSGGFVRDCKCPILTNFPTTSCCCSSNGCSACGGCCQKFRTNTEPLLHGTICQPIYCSGQACADWTCLSQSRPAPLKENASRLARLPPHGGATSFVPLRLAGYQGEVSSLQQGQQEFPVREYRDVSGILVSTRIKHSEGNISALEQTITNGSEHPLSTIVLSYSITLASGTQFALPINIDTFIGGAWLAPGKTWNQIITVDQRIPSPLRDAELSVQLTKLIGQPVFASSPATAASYEEKWWKDLELIRKVRIVIAQGAPQESAIKQIKDLLEKARNERSCADAVEYISYYIREPGKFPELQDFVQRATRLN